VRSRLAQLLEQQGATLAGFFYCPHHPDGTVPRYTRACLCRKPGSGLFRRASQQLGFSLRHSWMVGDILDDIGAARQANCRAILVDCGNETEWQLTPQRIPHYTVTDFDGAARIIVRHTRRQRVKHLAAAMGAR
jgi:histidinol phosphatase-like enzyme